MMGNTILAPRWFLFSSTTLLPSVQHNLFAFCVNLEITATQQLIFLTSEVLPSLFVKNVVRISPPLNNSWYHNTSCHLRSFLGPRIVFNRNTDNGAMTCEFKLLATLLLWSEWAIVHSKSFANWITILTLVVQPNPYFGRTLQPMFNCVCFPRAYFLISVDLTNVISLFT